MSPTETRERVAAPFASRLLWAASGAALLLCAAAFLLWGLNGAGMLFDMIVALCG